MSDYLWKRFWCPREREIFFTDKGYLADPDNEGSYCNSHLMPFEAIANVPCLILLGEPGIGKSTALATYLQKAQYDKSAQTRYLHRDLRAYSSELQLQRALFSHPEITSWQSDSSILHLFLDSLDESLLYIKTVTDMILEELQCWPSHRLFLRIACRTAQWRPTVEERLQSIWSGEALRMFELVPLRRVDVSTAAQATIAHPDVFLQDIERMAATPFAIKPITLKFLLNSYQQQGKLLTTQREIYEKGCERLCEETNPYRQGAGLIGNFTLEQRLRAAEHLAAITIFTNRHAIWTGIDWGNIPEADITLRACAHIEAREDYSMEPVIKEALATGLFTGRGIQELGWAHQTYAEFLAARFVTKTMSVEQIVSLIKHPDDPQGKLIPQLYETAAWIACIEPKVFQAIMDIEPDILLRSDVATADNQDRAELVSALLQYYDLEGALDDYQRNSARYRYLAHPTLAAQLKLYMSDKTKGHVARRVAIDIAQACLVHDLVDTLMQIALNETDVDIIRIRAASVVGQLGDDAAKVRLKPLLVDSNDTNDELKGVALRALWPQLLSADEFFAALTVPQNPRLIGVYERFLSAITVEHLHTQDLPVALTWAQQYAIVPHDALSNLIDGILTLAWQHLEAPEILQRFAQVAKQRLERYDTIVGGETIASAVRGDQGYVNIFLSHYRKDADKRGMLLEMLLPLCPEASPTLASLACSRTPVMYEEDMPWLLERLQQETDELIRQKLVLLILLVFKMYLPAHLEAISEASITQPLLAQEFKWLFEPVFLDSQEAENLKRTYHASQTQLSLPDQPAPLDPPPAEMVQQLLDKYEAGSLDAWWQLNRVLTISPTRIHFGNELAADITSLPGWQEANERTRTRIIDAAESYILAKAPEARHMIQERMHSWMGKAISYDFPLYAGYRAFLLLQRETPKRLEEVPPVVWQRWAPMLASYPLQKDDSVLASHHLLIRTAYQHASADIITTCLAQIDQQNQEMRALNCLHLVETCWDMQLKDALLDKAADPTLDPTCLRDVLTVIVTHDPAVASTIAETLLQEVYTASDYERATIVAGVLIGFTSDACWGYIWPYLKQNETFGRMLLLDLQRTEFVEYGLTQRLTPDQIADLFLSVVELFPPEEDPPMPSGFVSDRQLLSTWRSQLIIALQQKGTKEGCEALRKILYIHPEMEWIRWVMIDAERLLRQHTWSGFKPEEIMAMAKHKERRLVQNGKQLLAVIIESLTRLQETLHSETPARIFLWNDPSGKNKQKHYRPKDENSLSNYIKLHLEHDLKHRGIIVLREVEIRHATGGSSGERIDLYVDAYVAGQDRREIDILTVIIEVKGCWNEEVDTAMQTQLVERYLKDNSCRHGLYLIGWFNCPQWDCGDYRRDDAPKISLQEARVRYQQQAEVLTVQSAGRLLVKSFVLDTALR